MREFLLNLSINLIFNHGHINNKYFEIFSKYLISHLKNNNYLMVMC